MSPFLRNLGILALLALAIVVLNLQTSLVTAALLLQVAFFLALAFVAYMLWRDFGRREISLWPRRAQWVFYGAVALLVLDIGWFVVASLSGLDALAFFLVAAACVYAGIRTWRDQHRYG
jgi:small-conductance mechanosensitive channel